MANINLHNLARMTVSSTGTGTITLNAAVTGFLTFDLAGCSTAAAGSIVRYAIADTTKSEIAYGTYTSSALTLTRGSSTTGMKSTNSNSPIDMSNSAQVFITDGALDHPIVPDSAGTAGSLSLNMTYSGTATFNGTATHAAGTTFTAAITYGGVTLNNTVTGVGSMVLSGGPTFTGTVAAGDITATGTVTATTLSANAASGGMIATQAEMETATATDRIVSPGRVKYSPGVAKAWVKFNGAGVVAIQVSLNVTSITDNGTGNYTINFTTAFSTADYVSVGSVELGASAVFLQFSSPATSNIQVNTSATTFAAADAHRVHAVFFGDQ